MGTEIEYGIIGEASDVLNNYQGKGRKHTNTSQTNNSAILGMSDRGHFGGDYERQEIDDGLAADLGFSAITYPWRSGRSCVSWSVSENAYSDYSHYFNNGSMLANGARFYIDVGHPEYSTPECSNPVSAVIAEKAGERILEATSEQGKIARIFKNNTDGLNSYGAHENYLVDKSRMQSFKKLADFMTGFFVSRIVFTGSGKIGFNDEKSMQLERKLNSIMSEYASLEPLATGNLSEIYTRVRDGLAQVIGGMRENDFIFHLSQRADFFKQLIGLQTTYDRPIINTRDEPLADKNKYLRFHVINGDANMSEIATYLKLGTASLALDLFEDGAMETLELEKAVQAFHDFSRDAQLKTRVKVTDKGKMTAVEIQRVFYEHAEKAYRGRDVMTDDILNRWKFVLDSLEDNPMRLNRQIDWVIKKNLIDSFMKRTGKKINDMSVRNIDLQYHEVNRKTGLFYKLQNAGLVDRLVDDKQIEYAVENPPEDTRAYLRGELVRREDVSDADWDSISFLNKIDFTIPEPFQGTKAEVGDLFAENMTTGKLIAVLLAKGCIQKKFYFRRIYQEKNGKEVQDNDTRKTRKTVSAI